MKKILEGEEFNTFLETSDWRYSAAVVGLVSFFNYFSKDRLKWKQVSDGIYYNQEDLTEERFLEFIEYYFSNDMHHKDLEDFLSWNNFDEDKIKQVNEKMKANTILKNVFGKIKFDGNNCEVIKELISKNRNKLIKETFRNKNNLYKNFCNTNSLLEDKGQCCRLVGYSIDMGKKGKSVSYNFNKNNYVYEDEKEFDFIPIAFNGHRQAYFINANSTMKNLVSANTTFNVIVKNSIKDQEASYDSNISKREYSRETKKLFFNSIINTDEYINYDVEVITKDMGNDFFETLYIRDKAINNLKRIKEFYEVFITKKKIADGYWIDVYDEVINCILNNLRTDKLIEMFLKENEREYLVSKLISVNLIIENGGEEMETRTKSAYKTAKFVADNIPENKLNSYRQKLTSSLVFRDYDRYCDILIQLSNYVGKSFDFAFNLFEDFEGNKDVAYSFVNALSKKTEKKGE